MKSARSCRVVFVTAPGIEVARKIASELLKSRLIACANLLPAVESSFWWKGKIETSREVLMVLKTTRRKLPALEAAVLKLHPYDTPEILSLAPEEGTSRYLDWIKLSVAAGR